MAVFVLDRHRYGPLAVQGLKSVGQEIVDHPHECLGISNNW